LGTFTSRDLNEKNKLDLGKQHQYLTQNMCHEHIYLHLAAVIVLMRASDTWENFERILREVFSITNAKTRRSKR
jgi:hypothetical protein